MSFWYGNILVSCHITNLKLNITNYHLEAYFDCTGETLRHINGKFIESKHHSLRMSEERHGYVVRRKLGTPIHMDKALRSIVFENSKNAGFISAQKMRLRRPSTPRSSPHSSPRGYKYSQMYLDTIGE